MVGGHLLSGTLQGADYKVTRLGGWWDRPNIKRNVLARELADGDFPQPWHFEARYISIDGYVDCQDHAQMHHIMDQLNGLAVNRREYLTIQGHGQMSSALVEADGGALVEPVTDKLLRFELRFKANDPRKYGEERTADVGHDWTTLRQYGNYPAAPRFRLHAPSSVGDSGYRLMGRYPDGERTYWWYNYAGNNTIQNIDFATGRHVVLDLERGSRIRTAETFSVPPHTFVEAMARPYTSGSGEVTGTATWRDTWI